MSHILLRLGEAALQARKVGPRKVIGPILGRKELKDIRLDWLQRGKEWPYEHIYPGEACHCSCMSCVRPGMQGCIAMVRCTRYSASRCLG